MNQALVEAWERRRPEVVPGPNGCVLWNRSTKEGYGRKAIDGRRPAAHRWFYEQAHGPIPEGHHVHHTCGNTLCVNPEHLAAVAPSEHAATRRVLSPEAIAVIRASDASNRELGRRFGVSRRTISRYRGES